jgi:ABC-type glycerol-3-phosphate transport system substrate-binding protein
MLKKLYTLLAVLLIAAFALSACGTPATPQTIIQTVEVPVEVEVTATAEPKAEGGKELIVWWSHWANEPAKKIVIEQIVADYEAENPDVDIVLTWWDKNPLRDAVRSTMTAGGEGAPDITTFDSEVVEWVEAGWLLDLADTIPWDNLDAMAKNDATYPDLGYPGNYKLNLSKTTNMLFYNKDIFTELGITVPDNYQFTQTEFLDVVQKCSDAGYAGVADAIGNRKYMGIYPVQYHLFSLVGPQEFDLYNSGKKAWDSPEAKSVLDYSVALRDAGLWSESYSTMTIDEAHVYFHTQQKACMFYIPTWYTGRAFKALKDGGQDPAWQFGMLRYPAMDGGKANDMVWGGVESGYAVLSTTKHAETAKDIIAFVAQPKYGALWTAVTYSPSIIKYDPVADAPSEEALKAAGVTAGQWDWYWAEYDKVYGGLEVGLAPTARCGDFGNAMDSALADGLPQGLVTVDESVTLINAALCK